jgi:nucleoid DNA-binding protein
MRICSAIGDQGKGAMTKNPKKDRRIIPDPNAGAEVPITRVVVFEPSAVLKQRINATTASASPE